MRIPAFDYPKAQGKPTMGKSIQRNGKLLILIKDCKCTKSKIGEANYYNQESLSGLKAVVGRARLD